MKRSKLVSLVGISLLLVGCGKTSDTTKPTSDNTAKTEAKDTSKDITTTIVIGASAKQKSFVETQAKKFLSDNGYKNVTITMYEVGEDKAKDIADWESDAAPDIYGFASDQLGTLNSVGALAELPTKFSTELIAGMGNEAVDAGKLGESYYAYPYAGDNGYFLYYNKDVVSDEQAKTVEGITAACAAKSLKFGYALDTDSSFFSIGTFMSFGARYKVNLNSDGSFKSATSDFDQANGILGAKAVHQLAADTNVDITHTGARNKAPIDANGFGAVVEGSWNYDTFSKELGDKMGVAKLPTITVEGKTANLSSFLGYKLYGVNPKKSVNDTARLTLTHMIANYLVSAECQEARFDALNTVPTQKSVKAMEKVQNNGLVKALAAQAEFSVAQTTVPNNVWTGCTAALTSLQADDPDYATIMKTYADSIAASTKF